MMQHFTACHIFEPVKLEFGLGGVPRQSLYLGITLLIISFPGSTPPSSNYGTLRGLEHSLNPQLIKYAHETDFSIAQARHEDRHQLFTCYSSLPVSSYSFRFLNSERLICNFYSLRGIQVEKLVLCYFFTRHSYVCDKLNT